MKLFKDEIPSGSTTCLPNLFCLGIMPWCIIFACRPQVPTFLGDYCTAVERAGPVRFIPRGPRGRRRGPPALRARRSHNAVLNKRLWWATKRLRLRYPASTLSVLFRETFYCPLLGFIRLADPNFHCPGPIDLLLGSELWNEIFIQGMIPGDEDLKRLWELEDLSSQEKILSPEDAACSEEHFLATYKRETTGKFIVELPFKGAEPTFRNMRSIAERRFYKLETRLSNDPVLRKSYNKHRDFQRIVWRFDPGEPLRDFRLNTVTYGVSSSPYLALRSIEQLAVTEGHAFPLAARALTMDTYVDDIPTGAASVSEALELQGIAIPRQITHPHAVAYQLHGFADASLSGYAAVIYLRAELDNGSFKTHLVSAKSRVAPTKRITLPRLELCAAALLSDLVDTVHTDLSSVITIDSVFAWSDSTITLSWIASHPSKWKIFVGNRVAKIQRKLPSASWNYIGTMITQLMRPLEVCFQKLYLPIPLVDGPELSFLPVSAMA
ncbi:hypothetical protein MSG28_014027 [Choristoneura fumiferana]|uniref:Uncharacterized protein n=1 Tax=Choristoneura fumiferana TaxID=7141 RepID=A0ACC0JFK3_CHOFU|nr:hypothetical protein MSG28_014027 [Choristoneura fumiferana]